MYSFPLHRYVPAALAVVLPMAFAQSGSVPATPDSRNAAPSSVPLSYQSALADYRAYREQPVVSWREANDQVNQIGGWRAYAKETSPPDAVTAPVSGATGGKP